ncbi:MAG: response regulator [Nitrospinae bacterium]|nr:response regulator [Nitrospinota bacterium]
MGMLAGRKVLVVEDDAQARMFLKQFLEEENCIFQMAQDGEEAVERFDQFQPELVLLDLMLPKMNGTQVLKKIKAKDPDVKVIMTTGVSAIETAQECLRAGAYTHVVKPIDFDKLGIIITQALKLEDEGTGFVPEAEAHTAKEDATFDRPLLKSGPDLELKLDALISILEKTGLVTYKEIMEDVEKMKKESR